MHNDWANNRPLPPGPQFFSPFKTSQASISEYSLFPLPFSLNPTPWPLALLLHCGPGILAIFSLGTRNFPFLNALPSLIERQRVSDPPRSIGGRPPPKSNDLAIALARVFFSPPLYQPAVWTSAPRPMPTPTPPTNARPFFNSCSPARKVFTLRQRIIQCRSSLIPPPPQSRGASNCTQFTQLPLQYFRLPIKQG